MTYWSSIAILAGAVSALIIWYSLRRSSRTVRLGGSVVCAILAAAAVSSWQRVSLTGGSQPPDPRSEEILDIELAQLRPVRPRQVSTDGYVASQSCEECHPGKHASWSASYHRRMTQIATPEAIIGNFDDVVVRAQSRTYQLTRRRDVCWVEMDDPEAELGAAPRIQVPIAMTTGSHHMQIYWYPTGNSRIVGQLPIIFLNEIQRWIPRDAAFLKPPQPFSSETGRWNRTCIGCHATHGQPRPNERGEWDTQVGEFGIACEACHGPGRGHIERHRAASLSGRDDPIVNPLNLPHRRAAEVCGQCHSISTPKNAQTFASAQANGKSYRPGDNLADSTVLVREDARSRAHLRRYIGDDVDQYMMDQYWPDGMVRISGREFNGLVESACFQKGELSCLTCHQMHRADNDPRPLAEWANDQIRPEAVESSICSDCHQADQYGTRHTHHLPSSSGSECYNCHMPHTTYGLLKGIRSHEISSPSVEQDDIRAGRPNACNLCHLDKTAAWSAGYLHGWFDQEVPALDERQKNVASSILWLLRGDAGQRAIAAWNMGWEPALRASGRDWQAPFLALLLDDPYDAVRFITQRSLKQLPGFEQFAFDFVGPAAERRRAGANAMQLWNARRPGSNPQLLINQQGLRVDVVQELLQQRDNRPVTLSE